MDGGDAETDHHVCWKGDFFVGDDYVLRFGIGDLGDGDCRGDETQFFVEDCAEEAIEEKWEVALEFPFRSGPALEDAGDFMLHFSLDFRMEG